MKKFDAVLLLLVMVVSAGFVRAEDAKEVVVSSAEWKGIKAKKITWKKDGRGQDGANPVNSKV